MSSHAVQSRREARAYVYICARVHIYSSHKKNEGSIEGYRSILSENLADGSSVPEAYQW